jgi:hypothetical protein
MPGNRHVRFGGGPYGKDPQPAGTSPHGLPNRSMGSEVGWAACVAFSGRQLMCSRC